ncbi:hypothetical protein GXP67_32380 [Rhodocytophaga rosea]|uniref:Uncharacterized protein n=1 Tax=Rhodocytophaga rosea TaxID=2704465 RepID=A0A6C0GSC8_9BACT|nr:hypothetical protein [Rhodocytophaga rosea]QHT71015.1 hypothetical protein GXP67_32380 [Rhodocytophaga rosea]
MASFQSTHSLNEIPLNFRRTTNRSNINIYHNNNGHPRIFTESQLRLNSYGGYGETMSTIQGAVTNDEPKLSNRLIKKHYIAMKTLMIVIIILICNSIAKSQSDSVKSNYYQIDKSYIIDYSININQFIRQNRKRLFSKDEYKKLRKQEGLVFVVEIDPKIRKINKIAFDKKVSTQTTSLILSDNLIKRLEIILNENLFISNIIDINPQLSKENILIYRSIFIDLD